jgi:Tfp pilus assembly protein PilE
MRAQRGATLIELITVVTITGILSMSIGGILRQLVTNYKMSTEINALSTKANLSMDILRKDLSNAKSISQTQSTRVSFTNQDDNTVTYRCRSSQQDITRQESGGLGTKTFAANISACSFSYFDENLATTSDGDLVRIISISLTQVEGDYQYSLITNVDIKANT